MATLVVCIRVVAIGVCMCVYVFVRGTCILWARGRGVGLEVEGDIPGKGFFNSRCLNGVKDFEF